MKTQEKIYRDLELLSASTYQPSVGIITHLHWLWRSLKGTTPDKLGRERQVIHLENCWYCDRPTLASELWQKAQNFLRSSSQQDFQPTIQRRVEASGQVWWCVSDPATGQMTFLESEAEVERWLEEHFYR